MKAKDVKPKLEFSQRAPYLDNRLLFVPTFYKEHARFSMPEFCDPLIFGSKIPVHIEFCSGNGEWIVEAASKNPDIGWVAVEMKFARVRKIYSKAQTLRLKNILVVWGHAEDFIQHYLKDECIDKAFVHFPDPWPKQRHAKHRIIQKEFASSLHRILKNNGSLHLITDDLAYRDQMIDVLTSCFSSLDKTLYVQRTQEFHSYFYRLWTSLNRSIYSLNYSKKKTREIVLDVSHDAHIDVDQLLESAREIVSQGFKIVWVFDFKLKAHEFSFYNKALYHSYQLTFETLRDKVLQSFEEDTSCFRIFDGPLDFNEIATFSAQEQGEFERFVTDYPLYFETYPKMALAHFFVRSFVDLMECLGSYLPLEPPRAIHFNVDSCLTISEYADLFSKKNFEDIILSISHARIPSQRLITTTIDSGYDRALVIPSLDFIHYESLEKHILYLTAQGLEFCLLAQEALVDSWYGIEHLYVIENSLSDDSSRALDGFKAAMGQIHWLHDS